MLECRFESHGAICSVRDNGVGIASDQLERVFPLHTYRVRHRARGGQLRDWPRARERMVELHGGHIEARSAGLEWAANLWSRCRVLQ